MPLNSFESTTWSSENFMLDLVLMRFLCTEISILPVSPLNVIINFSHFLRSRISVQGLKLLNCNLQMYLTILSCYFRPVTHWNHNGPVMLKLGTLFKFCPQRQQIVRFNRPNLLFFIISYSYQLHLLNWWSDLVPRIAVPFLNGPSSNRLAVCSR